MSIPPPPGGHSRHSSAVSTSSAIRTASTPRSASPAVSPSTPIGDGLSRRLSWNRPRDEEMPQPAMTSTSNQHLSVGDAELTHGNVPIAGLGIEYAGSLNDGGGLHPVRSYGSSGSQAYPEEYDLGTAPTDPWGNQARPTASDTPRPYFLQYPNRSQGSFDSSASEGDTPPGDSGSNERLAFAPNSSTQHLAIRPDPSGSYGNIRSPHRRVPSRSYDENGNPRQPSMGTRISRHPTFRSVSNTLRKASVRVSHMMGGESDGRTRLHDLDGDENYMDDGEDKRGQVVSSPEPISPGPIPQQPDPKPPEQGLALRGKTLGIFGPNSRTRRLLHAILQFPFTEPIILGLIIANVVVLAIQSAPALNTPREDDGYFQSWEDGVLLILFLIFTLEMFARIIVTGLIIDPEVSLRQLFFSPTGFFPRLRNKLSRASRRKPATPRVTAAWRTQTSGSATIPPPKRKTTVIPEAPFQRAVAKQQDMSASGRPYLRHSWHRIDMIAVIAFWVTFLLALTGHEATDEYHIYIFRALGVLRAGRLLVITSGTTTILHSLKKAGPLLVTVAFFLIFAFALFSIIGVQSFRGSFRRQCILTDPNNSTNIIELGQLCGGHVNSAVETVSYLLLDGTPAAYDPKGYICPMGQICQTSDVNPNGGSNSFDNVVAALVQVVIITSINTWAPIMYLSMDSDYFGSCLYFIVAVVILNFWFINLLTAVVVNTFKVIRAETKQSAFGATDTTNGTEPQWATETTKKKSAGKILAFYEKTELIWVVLILVDLVSQASKTAYSSDSFLDLLKNLELAFTLAFDVEMIIRMVGHFPDWRTFASSGRNDFDLFLAVGCSIIQIPAISSHRVYPWLTIFQLLRWYRFILAFPRMKPLLVTVFGSFSGLFNMVIFLFLVNFLGALMAVQIFRGDLENDSTISFSQTYNAFLGMYQIFSSEDWTTILYDTMTAEIPYAQRWLAGVFLCVWFLFSNAVVLQMFIAVINENFAVAEEQKRKRQIEDFIRKSEPVSAHVSWIDRLNPYRLMNATRNAVKVDSLPASLVLPLKQTIGPDVGNVPEKYVGKDSTTKTAMKRLFGRNDEKHEAIPLRSLRRPRSGKFDNVDDPADDDRGLSDLLPPMSAGPSADEHMDALRERRNQQADFIAAHPSFDHSLWLFKQSHPLRRFCQSCVSPAYGERIFGRPARPYFRLAVKAVVFSAIVASIVVAGIATPEYRKRFYDENGVHRGTWFDLVEVALGTTFVLEALIKIIADSFIFAPNAYLLSLWNVLDFLMLIALLVNTTTSLIFIGGLSRVTRALKGFRALRLITLFGRLRDTLHAVLFAGASKILDASILMILYLIPFAVWGLNIFSGRLHRCNDEDVAGRNECIGMFMTSPVDGSLGYLVPRVWSNPSVDDSVWTFDSFRESILILFEIVSLEGWIDVMASGMDIVGKDLQPQTNASQWNAIFFVLFNLFGGVIILTLFLSVIIGNFSRRSGHALLTSEQRRWVDLKKYIKAQTPSQLPQSRPDFGIRAWCYDRATQKHGYWTWGFTILYYIHILLLMMEDFSENIFTESELDSIFLVLTMIYAIDLLIRFFGLGFKSFKANGWNIFDLIVITGSFATTIPALQAINAGEPTSQVNVQLQKLFLVAIAFKLVQRIDSLNQLFKTSVASLPAIGNLFLLWATLFLFFAILFIEVFGLTKVGNNSASRFQNYYSFGNALVMLAFMSTGEGWNGYMHDYTIQYPRCNESSSYFNSDCGSSAWAYGLFISWNIISMYIFLNMFTGVVVESFAYVYQMPGGASLTREEMRAFKKLWSEFDKGRTGYIRRKDFVKFFSRLSGVFEIRMYQENHSITNIMRSSIPDPVANASGRLTVVTGAKRAIDLRRMERQISQIDYRLVRQRRQTFSRLYHEARLSEEPGRGISFTAMLLMLAQNLLIDDEQALLLDDLLARREKVERVTDLVNLDRVRGLLRTTYWRRRFLANRAERKRTLNAEAEGIPAIVLEPTPASPPTDDGDPFSETASITIPRIRTPSPPGSRSSSPSGSPDFRGRDLQTPDIAFTPRMTSRHSPSLSVITGGQMARRNSTSSMLSSDDAHHRSQSPTSDFSQPPSPSEDYNQAMATSVWGDMMREALEQEDK